MKDELILTLLNMEGLLLTMEEASVLPWATRKVNPSGENFVSHVKTDVGSFVFSPLSE